MNVKQHTQNFLDQIKIASKKPLNECSMEELRLGLTKTIELFGAETSPIHKVEDFTIIGTDGNTIPLRLYTPSDSVKGIWFYTHGGGWTKGSVESYDSHLREMSKRLDVAILSVEYRLSPEHSFPKGHQDVFDAYLWMRENMNYQRYWLGGDSAGGNLTASVVCRLIEEQLPMPEAYIGIYPALDLRLKQDSYKRFADGYLLTTEAVQLYVNAYFEKQRAHAYNFLASPLLYSNMAAFPKTLLVTASHDPLFDEQMEFAEKLKKAHVPLEHNIVEGVVHPFMVLGKVFPETYDVMDWLKEKML
jgi:acetyl esterase